MIKTIAALLALVALSGCSLIPDFLRPAAPVAQVYPADAAGKDTRSAAETAWREFFPDAGLQALIAAALENNRDLRSAALRIAEARALYNIQSADLYPNINASFTGNRAHTPASLSASGRQMTSSVYQVGVSLASFEIDYLGRVRSLNQAALSLYLATDEARQSAQIGLIAEVAKAALAERAFAEQQDLARKTLAGREAAYQLSKQRFEVGASSALDLRANETLVLNARAALAILARQRAQAGNALVLLAGRPIADLPTVQSLSGQGIVSELPAGLPSDLLERRPDIRAAEARLKAANANIGAARAAFFPRLSLTAGFGTASNALSGLFDSGSGTWSFAPQLLQPLFDAGRNSANLTLTEVRKDLAVADYEKTIQVAFREVADALVARSLLDEQIDAQQAAQVAQADLLLLVEQRYRSGVANYIEVLSAERDLFLAEQSLVQARLLRLTNAIDLYRSLGGGLN
jgi:outer membrane protein, multidrug efflux system